MTQTRLKRVLAFAGLAAGLLGSAQAVILNPGDGSTPLPGTASASLPSLFSGTLLASLTSPFSNSSYSGSLYTAVIRETSGTLSFLYQLHVTAGPNFVRRMTTVDFAGFTTDVDWVNDNNTSFGFTLPAGPSPNPHNGDRVTGDVIGFDFFSGTNDPGLGAGDVTDIMYIRTNALAFTAGFTNVIDGDIARVNSFAPTSVPGPVAVIPMALGLATALLRRRRS